MNRLDAQLAENRVTGENNLRQRLEEKARRKKELMRKREELAAEENQLRADLQKNLKDADTLNREAERDFEKERRKARETAVGPDAVALRKEIEQQIQDNPRLEEQLVAEFAVKWSAWSSGWMQRGRSETCTRTQDCLSQEGRRESKSSGRTAN